MFCREVRFACVIGYRQSEPAMSVRCHQRSRNSCSHRWPDEELPQLRTKPAAVEEPSLIVTIGSDGIAAMLFAQLRKSSGVSVPLAPPVHIGDLRTAQPPDVGRAGHLLLPSSPILLRKRGTLKGDAATHRYRKAQESSMRSHIHPFFGLKRAEFRTKSASPYD